MITKPAYTYSADITHIYDGDNVKCNIDLYDRQWKIGETIRLYGIDAHEIKRSKTHNRDSAHVKIGYDQRDALLKFLGLDPNNFRRVAKYQKIETPIRVIIQTLQDESGKFGRLLGILHKNGINVNEQMRDVIGGVNFFDDKTYTKDYPIKIN